MKKIGYKKTKAIFLLLSTVITLVFEIIELIVATTSSVFAHKKNTPA